MIKKSAVFLFLAVVVGLFYYLDIFSFSNQDEVREFVLSFGFYAPIIFIILFTIVPLTLFPDAILAIAGGLIFGLWEGSLYIIIGALCGATLSFFIARVYAPWLQEKLKNEKFLNLEKNVEKNGFLIVFLLRLIPLVPFDIISYSAGFSSIKYRDFIMASFVGIIPGVLVYANIGAQSLEIGSKSFYLSIAFLIALIVVSTLFKKSIKKRLVHEDI